MPLTKSPASSPPADAAHETTTASTPQTPSHATTEVEPPVPSTAETATGGRISIHHALGYLEEVKSQFQDRPDVYNRFLDIVMDFKNQVMTTPELVEQVSTLFRGHSTLITRFNIFFPPSSTTEESTEENATEETQAIAVSKLPGTVTQDEAGVSRWHNSGRAETPTGGTNPQRRMYKL